MKSVDLIKEYLSNLQRRVWMLEGQKMSKFGKLVNDYEDDLIAL